MKIQNNDEIAWSSRNKTENKSTIKSLKYYSILYILEENYEVVCIIPYKIMNTLILKINNRKLFTISFYYKNCMYYNY